MKCFSENTTSIALGNLYTTTVFSSWTLGWSSKTNIRIFVYSFTSFVNRLSPRFDTLQLVNKITVNQTSTRIASIFPRFYLDLSVFSFLFTLFHSFSFASFFSLFFLQGVLILNVQLCLVFVFCECTKFPGVTLDGWFF